MRMLVLGGTSFVGRHIVEAALAAGHDVTLFNRGKTNPGLFEGLEQRHGDRKAGDYASLTGSGAWDAVIDVNAYYPRAVREVIDALGGPDNVGHYTFISTCSVYESPGNEGPVTEDAPLATVADPTTEDVTGETYGGLKVLCEQEAASAFPGRCLIIRPGIVGGPHDPTDRFTYWVRRAAVAGGPIAAPNRPDQPVQVVHGRDQGDFVVAATADRIDGPFNTVGPSEELTFEGMIRASAEAAGTEGSVEIEWVDESFLDGREFHFPMYIPSAMNYDALFRCSSEKAQAAGFRNRPIVDTARDTLDWDRTRDQSVPMGGGAPTPEQEAALLEEWRNR